MGMGGGKADPKLNPHRGDGVMGGLRRTHVYRMSMYAKSMRLPSYGASLTWGGTTLECIQSEGCNIQQDQDLS